MMELIQQFFSTGGAAFGFTAALLVMESKKRWDRSSKAYYISLAAVLLMLVFVPNGWSAMFPPELEEFSALSIDPMLLSTPEVDLSLQSSRLFKTDLLSTITGAVFGWLASVWYKNKFRY